ncbi:MAG: hypothetical protein OEV30_13215, partial [Ignavibacteria bacterium]|nr:hypothetical protein [Ignavibacteria bacterium]
MLTDLQHVRASAAPDISPSELEYIAFSGERDLAHGIFRSIPPEYRGSFCNRYILSEVMTAGVTKLRKFLSASAEDAAMEEKLFVDQTARLFLSSCRQTGTFPRELFESLLLWANELAELSLLRESLSYHNDMVAAGIRKFPDLNVRCMMDRANLLNKTGDVAAAQELFNTLAERPYLLADRDAVPELMFNLGRESLLKGDITLYKSVLFQGLRHFYTTIEDRRRFVDQLRSTYRYSTRVFLDRKIRMTDRFLFAVHLLYFKSRSVRFLEAVRVSSLLKVAVLGYVYWLNYVHRRGWTDLHQVSRDSGAPARDRFVVRRKGSVRKSVLITRAMGGIGDLLMMTPGLHALKQKIGDNQIILAVPKRYFPVFEGNPDVELADIEDGKLDYSGHRKWLNFSDCPASRVESRTAPRVRKSRIEIFAAAMGIGPLGRIRMDHRPRYFLSERDRL